MSDTGPSEPCGDLSAAPFGGGELPEVLPAEAIIGFAAWLTTRDAVIEVGATREASTMVQLCETYCRSQGFAAPRDDFHHYLRPGPSEPIVVEPIC